jgi:hypothetical protein
MDTLGVPYTDTTLNEALKHIGKLQARVDVQDARIAELERRVSTLEQSGPGEATNTIGQTKTETDTLEIWMIARWTRSNTIGQTKTETDTNPITPYTPPATAFSALSGRINDEYHGDNEPTLRVSTSPVPPPDIPPGSLLMADFAQLHGVPRATFARHCTQGMRGERVETIERPKPGREKYNEKERWLSPEQQEEALRFWGRQNVRYSLCARTECGCIGNVR